MKLYLSKVTAWHPEVVHCKDTDSAYTLPSVNFIPAIQRRRLSSFAKLAFYTAYQTLGDEYGNIPIIFSSRHGDIIKTSELLSDIVKNESLSPTSFSLSVHNAIPGLLSINTKNKASVNAISAGKDSFFMGLVDAYAKLKLNDLGKILVLHTDLDLPELFLEFKDEQQIPNAFACMVSLENDVFDEGLPIYEVDIEMSSDRTLVFGQLPATVAFSQWLMSDDTIFSYQSDNFHWSFTKNE